MDSMDNEGRGWALAAAALIALIILALLREEANAADGERVSATARKRQEARTDAEFAGDLVRMLLIGAAVALIIAAGFFIYYA